VSILWIREISGAQWRLQMSTKRGHQCATIVMECLLLLPSLANIGAQYK
jgi:hypothetical protein